MSAVVLVLLAVIASASDDEGGVTRGKDLLVLGRYEESEKVLLSAERKAIRAGDAHAEMEVLHVLSAVYLSQELWTKAAPRLERLHLLLADQPHRLDRVIRRTQGHLALCYEQTGRPLEAEVVLKSIAWDTRDGSPPDRAAALRSLGRHFETTGRLIDAASYYQEAWTVAKPSEWSHRIDGTRSLVSLARVYISLGKVASARGAYEEALASPYASPFLVLEAALGLGEILSNECRPMEARDVIAAGASALEEIGASHEQRADYEGKGARILARAVHCGE